MSHHCSHGHIHPNFSQGLLTPEERRHMAIQLTLAMTTIGLILLSLLWRTFSPEQSAIA